MWFRRADKDLGNYLPVRGEGAVGEGEVGEAGGEGKGVIGVGALGVIYGLVGRMLQRHTTLVRGHGRKLLREWTCMTWERNASIP